MNEMAGRRTRAKPGAKNAAPVAKAEKPLTAAMYTPGDWDRVVPSSDDGETFRSPWRRDYARLIHSASFRRLQGKTQVFPGHESDFYRNRLTHSLEVAQIAKSIAIRLNATNPHFANSELKIEPDIVEFAGLAHDLGHPPFGHNGEEALDECMREYGGFEGNAQSLRIVSRLEKKTTLRLADGVINPFDSTGSDLRCGLNLTYRSLASLLKYDTAIPERYEDRNSTGVQKGYYKTDSTLVSDIKRKVLGNHNYEGKFKTVECSIMDIADDIAYSTYDLEDNFKAGFLSPLDLFVQDEEIYVSVAETINKRLAKQYFDLRAEPVDEFKVRNILFEIFEQWIFKFDKEDQDLLKEKSIDPSAKKMLLAAGVQEISATLARDGYARTEFTSALVQQFLDGIEVVPNNEFPQLHQVRLQLPTFLKVEVLKNVTYHAVIRAPGLQVVEYRGKDIVKSIFEALSESDGVRLLPADFRALCKGANVVSKHRTICDFIAGMTDRYAIEFYSRLFGATNLTIHKPL